eukprot:4509626-Amphidinium_carterae.1
MLICDNTGLELPDPIAPRTHLPLGLLQLDQTSSPYEVISFACRLRDRCQQPSAHIDKLLLFERLTVSRCPKCSGSAHPPSPCSAALELTILIDLALVFGDRHGSSCRTSHV